MQRYNSIIYFYLGTKVETLYFYSLFFMNILAPHVNFFGYAVFVLRYEIIFAGAASNDGVETSLDHEHCFNIKTSHFVCCITQEYCRNKHNTCITGVENNEIIYCE